MSTFIAGDRVEVVKPGYMGIAAGSVGTVERLDRGLYEVRIDGHDSGTWPFLLSELAPVRVSNRLGGEG